MLLKPEGISSPPSLSGNEERVGFLSNICFYFIIQYLLKVSKTCIITSSNSPLLGHNLILSMKIRKSESHGARLADY